MEKQDKEEKCRVVVVLTEKEKEGLKVLAWENRRSMSGYFRELLISAINNYDFERY